MKRAGDYWRCCSTCARSAVERGKADRALAGELRLDRTVGIEGIGHAVDHARLHDRDARRQSFAALPDLRRAGSLRAGLRDAPLRRSAAPDSARHFRTKPSVRPRAPSRRRRGGGFVLVASPGRKQQVATRRAIGRRRWQRWRRLGGLNRRQPASAAWRELAASSAQGGGDAARSIAPFWPEGSAAVAANGWAERGGATGLAPCVPCATTSFVSRQVHARRATCRPGSGPCTE